MQIETQRLVIRSFVAGDLEPIHGILQRAFEDHDMELEDRRSWLEWSRLNQVWLPRMHQLPYGDLALALKEGGELIGSVGLVPLLDVYEKLPGLSSSPQSLFNVPEVGLFWAVDPPCQGNGYATEAARGLVNFAFHELRLKRLLATTEHANAASQAVMRKLGMELLRNPDPEPPWMQVVGVIWNQRFP